MQTNYMRPKAAYYANGSDGTLTKRSIIHPRTLQLYISSMKIAKSMEASCIILTLNRSLIDTISSYMGYNLCIVRNNIS